MATDKQLKANRDNARKSTGPRSQEGKARSRRNSRKHGLTATMLVTGYEDAVRFEELRDELMNQHDPQSPLECELVERLAGIVWRQRRIAARANQTSNAIEVDATSVLGSPDDAVRSE
jgi:hypothetical protein